MCVLFGPLLRQCCDARLRRHLSRTVQALTGSPSGQRSGGYDLRCGARKMMRSTADTTSSTRWCGDCRGGSVPKKDGWSCGRSSAAWSATALKQRTNVLQRKTLAQVMLDMSKDGDVYEAAFWFLYKLRYHVVHGTGEEGKGSGDAAGAVFAEALNGIHQALGMAIATLKESAPSSSSAETEPRIAVICCTAGYVVNLMSTEGRWITSSIFCSCSSQRTSTLPLPPRGIRDRILIHPICRSRHDLGVLPVHHGGSLGRAWKDKSRRPGSGAVPGDPPPPLDEGGLVDLPPPHTPRRRGAAAARGDKNDTLHWGCYTLLQLLFGPLSI